MDTDSITQGANEDENQPLLEDLQTSSTNNSKNFTKPQKRGVNALQLTMMIYFFTSGGPFGIEPAVGAAGPLLTLIALIIIPLFWSLPQALMAAELSLMMPENGGNVVWVQTAFGNFIGWFNAFCNITANFSSLALLAVLFVDYLPFPMTSWENWLLKFAFVFLNTILNILGLRWISRMSLFFLIFVLTPFVVEIIIVIMDHKLNIDALNFVPPHKEIEWGLFLSTVIWSYGGFDSMGSLAGEVKGGRATFLTGIVGSFPLIFINYFFPIFVGYSVDTHYQNWVSGFFTTLAYKLSGWLGAWMVASSAISNFGQFNSAFAPLSRVVWAMARYEGSAQKLPTILGWSWQRHTGTIRPIAAVLFTGAMCTILVALPFNILVQIFLVIRVCNLTCEYAALIKLRYAKPDEARPFVVPGGIVGAWSLGVPTLILGIFTIVNASWEVWIAGGVALVAILSMYGIKLLWTHVRQRLQASSTSRSVNT